MIGLDTNILARYIAQDDPAQTAAANALIDSLTASKPGFVALVVMIELVWVMQSCYQASHATIVAIVENVLSADSLVVEQADIIRSALARFRDSKQSDFADCLIERCAHHAGARHTFTFDRKAAKLARMKLLEK